MTESTNILPLIYRKTGTALELQFNQADDSHFCDVHMVRLKTGVVVRSHYILLSDVPQWIGVYESDGWRQFSPQGTTLEEDKEQIQSDKANLKPDISATIQQ